VAEFMTTEPACLGRAVRFAFALFLTTACGEGEKDATTQNIAATGGSSQSAGSGGSDATAGAATAGAGIGGTSGAGGSAGMPVCPEGLQEFSAADVDLTLGGLNADLPAPSRDCLTAEPGASTCVALSAVIDGTAREVVCTRMGAQATDGTGVTCSNADDETVSLLTNNFGGTKPPGTFVTEQGDSGRVLQLGLSAGTLSSNAEGFTEARLAGWTNKYVESKYCRTASWGVIAASWSDTELGEARVRGTFHTRSY
jgi:hypothetical protein